MKLLQNCTILTYDLQKDSQQDYQKLARKFKKLGGEKIATTTYIFPKLIRNELEEILESYSTVKRYAVIEIFYGKIKKRDYTIEVLQRLVLLALAYEKYMKKK